MNTSKRSTRPAACAQQRLWHTAACDRQGKVLVLLLLSLSAILGVVGLIFDAGLLTSSAQDQKHATDAAAMAAAMELRLAKSSSHATSMATAYVQNRNELNDATIDVFTPPQTGIYAGRAGFVEVQTTRPYQSKLIHVVGGGSQHSVCSRSVAGIEAATVGAALMVLDPDPPSFSIAAIPLVLPALPSLLGGLETLGLGAVRVDGAVLVNTTWGGVDEDGNLAGVRAGPPYAVSCTPLLPLTALRARDLRVSGGVDDPVHYRSYPSGGTSPLKANRLPTPDPFADLPAPSTASDGTNVNATLRGGVRVVGLPIITPPTVLYPGVYEWIEVASGRVVFEPGVYIIRSVNPITQISLNILAGSVTAQGVMFYITNSPTYDGTSGLPDANDSGARPAQGPLPVAIPSVVLNAALLNGNYSPLNAPASPFHRMLIYQRKSDLRPIVVSHVNPLGGGTITGTVYSKWGHVIFAGDGVYDMRFVAGTVRLLSVLGMTIAPSALLPPAYDVYLVE